MARIPDELGGGWNLKPPTAVAEGGGIRVTVHRDLADMVAILLDASVQLGYEFDDQADDWGYAHREVGGRWVDGVGFVGGVGVWSMHAFGVSVDVNAADNPRQRRLRTNIPGRVIDLWERHGWYWGGRFSTPDPMHFEYRRTRSQAAGDTARARRELGRGTETEVVGEGDTGPAVVALQRACNDLIEWTNIDRERLGWGRLKVSKLRMDGKAGSLTIGCANALLRMVRPELQPDHGDPIPAECTGTLNREAAATQQRVGSFNRADVDDDLRQAVRAANDRVDMFVEALRGTLPDDRIEALMGAKG